MRFRISSLLGLGDDLKQFGFFQDDTPGALRLNRGLNNLGQPQMKKAATGGRLLRHFEKLKPIQESRIHPHIVLVANAREAEHHPVKLDCAEDQLAFSKIRSTT